MVTIVREKTRDILETIDFDGIQLNQEDRHDTGILTTWEVLSELGRMVERLKEEVAFDNVWSKLKFKH